MKIIKLPTTPEGWKILGALLLSRGREAQKNVERRKKAQRDALNSPEFWKSEITI